MSPEEVATHQSAKHCGNVCLFVYWGFRARRQRRSFCAHTAEMCDPKKALRLGAASSKLGACRNERCESDIQTVVDSGHGSGTYQWLLLRSIII